jgi:hypothetical protein
MEDIILKDIPGMWKQVSAQPACLYVILLVNVAIFMVEAIPQIPSRLIVIVGPVLGGFLWWRLGSISSVPFECPHPNDILIANGVIAGLVAVMIHVPIVILLRKKFGWPPESAKKTQLEPEPKDPQI